MEEQQPARSEPNIVLQQEPLDPERVLTSYPSDPAKWDQIDDRMHEYFALNHPCQNIGDFSASQRKYGDINRSLTKEHFFRKKLNGETLSRKWLVYSPSTGTNGLDECEGVMFAFLFLYLITGVNMGSRRRDKNFCSPKRLVSLGCLSRMQSSKAHPEKHPDQWRELLNSPDQELSC
ncbi:zinc finger MYM-type 1-like protein [Labeo rohita]|uniref:Zinc finger MYM-type 1-like protein n=1 Tax=Labeo rohita TaxID=84645 RepID=A0A498P361_LABRO|nr:zinc finger MYM-type 1-like protein [Labeo rohita]RXN38631.1 zinc finger MYM-type 1-like protein [Labeo rohita]